MYKNCQIIRASRTMEGIFLRSLYHKNSSVVIGYDYKKGHQGSILHFLESEDIEIIGVSEDEKGRLLIVIGTLKKVL